jgi:hypothetical protein
MRLKNSSTNYSYIIIIRSGLIIYLVLGKNIPYILESNPHPFYSCRGLKNQKRIRIECRLYSRSRAEFGKMIEPVYVPYEQYKVAKTRCGLDSRIYGI